MGDISFGRPCGVPYPLVSGEGWCGLCPDGEDSYPSGRRGGNLPLGTGDCGKGIL